MAFDRNHNNNYQRRPYDSTKEIRYVHSPFSVTHVDTEKESLSASCDKDGRITIVHTDKITEEYDEVTFSASFIFKLANMLRDTRKVYHQDRVEKKTV